MLTANDLVFASILPLIIGLSVAVFVRCTTRSRCSHSIGVLSTLIAGYFGRYGVMNFAYAQGETTSEKVFQSFSQTSTQLLSPSTAIQWIPIIAFLCFAISILVARLESANCPNIEKDPSPRSPLHSLLHSLLVYGLLVLLSALAIVRLLWTSVYFTDRFSPALQVGYVVVPAAVIAAIWMGGFNIRVSPQQIDHQPISRWSSISTLLLSASALVLMASSGSFTIGLLQLPVLSAAMVGAVFIHSPSSHCPINSNAWLIASAVCLPVAVGFFFAEVRWETAVLFFTSSILLTFFPPLVPDNNFKKIGIAIAACLPAIAAATWAAIALSQAIQSPYGGYQ